MGNSEVNRLAKIIAVTNQKGGVGKTTTSVNLGASLATLGKRVLLVDIDPQGNTTSGVGINKADVENCIYDVLINEVDPKQAIADTAVKNLKIIPATIQLAGAEIELVYDCSVFRRRYVYVHDGDKVVVLLVGVEGHDVEIFFGRRQIVYERRMADLGAYGARCDKNRRKN